MVADPFQLADTLSRFITRSGYTTGQLARLSGVPKPTIVNWAEGRVRRPRLVHDMVRLAATLHLDEVEASELLRAAGHPTLAEWRRVVQQTGDEAGQHLLAAWPSAAFEGRPLSTSRPVPFQALPNLPYFVGRKELLTEIEKAIKSNEKTAVTSLCGMAGAGKTALALHLAYTLRDNFRDGVLWARVDTSDTLSILNTFANAYELNVSHVVDLDSRSRLVRELLANKNALIVLDNAQNSEQVKPLLPPSGQCAVIITTRRHDLSVMRGGNRFEIGPFDAQAAEAELLFGRVLGTDRLAAEKALFVQIAGVLGHLPLAIDIAAARLAYEPGWSTQKFLDRLRQEKRRLGELDFEDQSVRLSFNASFAGLSPQPQQIFAVCGMFSGDDFSETAVAAIAAVSLEDAQDGLRKLFMLSLVQKGRQAPQPRYRLHPLLRDYAQHQPLVEESWKRFVTYFVQLVQAHQLDFPRLAMEQRHIFTTVEKSQKLENWSALIAVVNGIYPFLEARGWYKLAANYLQMAEMAVTRVAEPPLLLLHYQAGRLAQRQGEYIEAETRYETALELARQQEDRQILSHLLRALGVLAARRGDFVLADAYYKEGLALASSLGKGGVISDFLRGMGVQSYVRGDFARAEAFYEAGLALAGLSDEETQSPRGLGGMAWGLGVLAQEEGNWTQAANYFAEALRGAQSAGYHERVIILYRHLAEVYLLQDKRLEASLLLQEGLQIAREMGHRWQIARVLAELGEYWLHAGETAVARQLFTELYEMARIMQSKELVAVAQFGLARSFADTDQLHEAQRYGQLALDTFTEMGHQQVQQVKLWLHEITLDSERER